MYNFLFSIFDLLDREKHFVEMEVNIYSKLIAKPVKPISATQNPKLSAPIALIIMGTLIIFNKEITTEELHEIATAE